LPSIGPTDGINLVGVQGAKKNRFFEDPFFAPTPTGCIHDGWRGPFTKLEYLILNQDFPLH
jgi:hypothetical protein